LFTAVLAAALLAGCATPRKPIPPDGNYWHGRLLLKVEGNPPETTSASFELSGTAEAGELILLTPLGTTVAVLNWKPGEVLLQQSSGNERHFDTLDQLAQEATGTAFPVAQLFAWLKRGNQMQAAAIQPAAAASAPVVANTQSAIGGWQADLSQLADGKLYAKRLSGGPPAELRLLLEK
jgi:outer membrane lipoprotein LolB